MKVAAKKNKAWVICAYISSIATIVLFFDQKQKEVLFPIPIALF